MKEENYMMKNLEQSIEQNLNLKTVSELLELAYSMSGKQSIKICAYLLKKKLSYEEKAKVYSYRALENYNLHYFKRALNDFNKAISLDKSNDTALFMRARTKEHLEDFQGAIEDYLLCASRKDASDIHYGLAEIYFHEFQEYQKGIKEYKKFLELEKTSEKRKWHFMHGDAFSYLEKFNEAIKEYRLGMLHDDGMREYCKKQIHQIVKFCREKKEKDI